MKREASKRIADNSASGRNRDYEVGCCDGGGFCRIAGLGFGGKAS